MEGSSVGQYRIIRKIGEGGMGTVWVGEHALLGRKAAIKVLLPEFTTREEIVQRFFNEARAVTAIADPGIVQVFDFGYAQGSAYIVMELLEGEAMDARLRRIGRFAPVAALRLMAQIATSLGAAHAKGVIHRDLKPENIFIVGDPAVTGGERTKILDFGIAKLAGDESSKVKTRTGMVMGTPVYMSPEQCRGAASIDARSDIYTLGCVLFTMLCGRPPFESDSSGDLIIMHVRDAHPPPSSVVPTLTPEIDGLIARCLEKDPNRRFQSTAELVQALSQVEGSLYGTQSNRHRPTPAPPDARTHFAGGQLGTGPYPQHGTPPPYQGHGTPAPYQGHGTPAPYQQHPSSPPYQQHPSSPPYPQHGTNPQQGPSPTTLSMASGGGTMPPVRKKGALYAGLVVGVLAIGGGVFALVGRGGSETDTSAQTQPEPPPVATPDAQVVADPVVVTPAATPDAGVGDAQPAIAVEAVDAGVTTTATTTIKKTDDKKRERDKRRPPKDGGSKQGGSNASTTSGGIDRGD